MRTFKEHLIFYAITRGCLILILLVAIKLRSSDQNKPLNSPQATLPAKCTCDGCNGSQSGKEQAGEPHLVYKGKGLYVLYDLKGYIDLEDHTNYWTVIGGHHHE